MEDFNVNHQSNTILNTTSLSVVMPAFNEASHICDNLLLTGKVLSSVLTNFEIICVNDGSSDNTLFEMNKAAQTDNHIKVITYNNNKGKGYAVKQGIDAATYTYTAFLDSDLDISPDHLLTFLITMLEKNADIAIGSKLHKDSQIDYPFSRKFLSYGYYMLLRIMFHLNLKDTQTGIKMYKTEIIKPIAATTTTNGFAFDIEMLAQAQQEGAKIIELPITLVFTRGKKNGLSRIKFKSIYLMFENTVAVRRRLNQKSIK